MNNENYTTNKCEYCPFKEEDYKATVNVSSNVHYEEAQNEEQKNVQNNEYEEPISHEWFKNAIDKCRNIFVDKLGDYGPSWRIMRSASLTDQIYIKASRIRSLEESKVTLVGDGILTEFEAIVNYGIIALIQLQYGYSDKKNTMTSETAKNLYDQLMDNTFTLMVKKNHDYNEAWKLMRLNSYTDFILMKILRIMEIESNGGKTKVSEPIDSNYYDIINYALFGIIKLTEPEWQSEVMNFNDINFTDVK